MLVAGAVRRRPSGVSPKPSSVSLAREYELRALSEALMTR